MRRTVSLLLLALTALFESGLQHLADRPESFLAQPQEVQDYLSRLPAAWDETRYVSGPYSATAFADSGDADAPWDIRTLSSLPDSVPCQPRGGFVWVITLNQ